MSATASVTYTNYGTAGRIRLTNLSIGAYLSPREIVSLPELVYNCRIIPPSE